MLSINDGDVKTRMGAMKAKPDHGFLRRFGAKLRQLRQQKGLSQAQLGKRVKIGSRTVFLYEQGRMAPSIEVVARLARFFHVTTDELIFDDEAQLKAVQDRDLIECLTQADQLSRRERSLIKDLIEMLLIKHPDRQGQRVAA